MLALPQAVAEPEVKSARKAAVLLAVVGNEVGAGILRQLSEDDAHLVAREVTQLSAISAEERSQVLEEFLRLAENIDLYRAGGLEFAKSVLYAAFGPEAGRRMTDRLAKAPDTGNPHIEALRQADPAQLAKVIRRENPQTIALILCHLTTANAASLLAALPAELRAPVVRRMASLDQVAPEVIERLAKAISSKLKIASPAKLESCGGVRAVAQLLNRVENATGEQILGAISTDDPVLCQSIRQLMFVFTDLLNNISKSSLQTLVAQADRRVLTLALKGTSGQMKQRLMGLMSSRAAEMLQEDLDALGPVRIRDVEDAQQQIMALAVRLQSEGAISLQPESAEEYIT